MAVSIWSFRSSSVLTPSSGPGSIEQWAGYTLERYGKTLSPSQPYAIVARKAGRVVGFAEGEVQNAVLRLGRLIVSPEWRHQGVGSHLLRAVEHLALERGCAQVRLATLLGGAAQQFYAERGFFVSATLPRWNEERDFVFMERPLKAEADPGRS